MLTARPVEQPHHPLPPTEPQEAGAQLDDMQRKAAQALHYRQIGSHAGSLGSSALLHATAANRQQRTAALVQFPLLLHVEHTRQDSACFEPEIGSPFYVVSENWTMGAL